MMLGPGINCFFNEHELFFFFLPNLQKTDLCIHTGMHQMDADFANSRSGNLWLEMHSFLSRSILSTEPTRTVCLIQASDQSCVQWMHNMVLEARAA
jgi:hypothetical protein